MPSSPISAPGVVTRIRALALVGALAALVAAGCVAGSPDRATQVPAAATAAAPVTSIEPSVVPSGAPSVIPSIAPSLEPTAVASDVPGPPSATLTGAGIPPVMGALGGYTWLGEGSDAPWIVPPPADAVRGPGPFAVAFDPSVAAEAWTARWAPVRDGAPGDPAGSSSGGPGPILISGPDGSGTWSLQLDVRFAGGGRAAWYWRLLPAP